MECIGSLILTVLLFGGFWVWATLTRMEYILERLEEERSNRQEKEK